MSQPRKDIRSHFRKAAQGTVLAMTLAAGAAGAQDNTPRASREHPAKVETAPLADDVNVSVEPLYEHHTIRTGPAVNDDKPASQQTTPQQTIPPHTAPATPAETAPVLPRPFETLTPMSQRDIDGGNAETVALRREFARTNMGREMLMFLNRHKLSIVFDNTDDTHVNNCDIKHYGGVYCFHLKTVKVNSALPAEMQTIVLAHEIRHAWQDIRLGFAGLEKKTLTPTQQWTLRQTLEADAAAYSAYFWADRLERIDPQNSYKMPVTQAGIYGLARQMRDHMRRTGDLTAEDFRTMGMEAAFRSLPRMYTDLSSSITEKRHEELVAYLDQAQDALDGNNRRHAARLLRTVGNRLSSTPTDEEFDAHIREYFAMDISTRHRTIMWGFDIKSIFQKYADPQLAAAHGVPDDLPAISTAPDADAAHHSATYRIRTLENERRTIEERYTALTADANARQNNRQMTRAERRAARRNGAAPR